MLILCNAEGLAACAAAGDFVVLQLSRAEIERGLVGDAVDRLMILSDSAAFSHRYANSLAIEVAGYDEDPRELYEIPDVRAFFAALTTAWPYWLHFLEKDHDALHVLLCQIVETKVVGRASGQVSARIQDLQELHTTLNRLFDAMNALYDMHGFTHTDNVAMTRSVMRTVNRLFGEGHA